MVLDPGDHAKFMLMHQSDSHNSIKNVVAGEVLNMRSNLLVEETGSGCTGKGSLKCGKVFSGVASETGYFLCARNAFREAQMDDV